MSAVDNKQPARRPTDGMLALARDIAEGRQRDAGTATKVPQASISTRSTGHERKPRSTATANLCPSALLPGRNGGSA